MSKFYSAHFKSHNLKSLTKCLFCLVFAGVLIFSMSIPMGLAFAANTPEAGSQSGTGKTTFKVITQNSGLVSGTNDASNSDGDNDGLGDNLAFSVPTSVNFVAKADGTLVGPSNLDIRNMSVFPVHVGQMRINALNGFNIVANAAASDLPNSLDLSIGPADDMMSIVSGTTTYNMNNPVKWNMDAVGNENGNYSPDLDFNVVGHLNNVTKDIAEITDFMEVNWYLDAGEAMTPFSMLIYDVEVEHFENVGTHSGTRDVNVTSKDTVILDATSFANGPRFNDYKGIYNTAYLRPRPYVVYDKDLDDLFGLSSEINAETDEVAVVPYWTQEEFSIDISGFAFGLDLNAYLEGDKALTCEEFLTAMGLTLDDVAGKKVCFGVWYDYTLEDHQTI